MAITAAMVKQLRDKTNAGMMDCKKALAECNGDLERAVDWLRQKGLVTARKRAGRVTKEGVVSVCVAPDKKSGAMVELNCETDFVAKTDSFKELANDIAAHVIHQPQLGVCKGESVLGQTCAAKNLTIEDMINSAVGSIGENINLRRLVKVEAVEGGFIHAYIHGAGRLGVLIELKVEKYSEAAEELAHNLAMQIAAANPLALDAASVPSTLIEREKNLYMAKAAESGKPEHLWEKIVEGNIKKFFSEVVLLEQAYVREPSKTVSKVLKEAEAQLGETSIVAFHRFQLGEEIEGENVAV